MVHSIEGMVHSTEGMVHSIEGMVIDIIKGLISSIPIRVVLERILYV